MRQQVGRLYTLGKLFFYNRTQKPWNEEKLPNLTLYFFPRSKQYADSYEEYVLRREIYCHFNKELPREYSKNPPNWEVIFLFIEK